MAARRFGGGAAQAATHGQADASETIEGIQHRHGPGLRQGMQAKRERWGRVWHTLHNWAPPSGAPIPQGVRHPAHPCPLCPQQRGVAAPHQTKFAACSSGMGRQYKKVRKCDGVLFSAAMHQENNCGVLCPTKRWQRCRLIERLCRMTEIRRHLLLRADPSRGLTAVARSAICSAPNFRVCGAQRAIRRGA